MGILLGALGMWSAASPMGVGLARLVSGFSVGLGVPASLTTVAEVAPAASRTSQILVCYAALVFGALYADLGLLLFLPDLKTGDWRSLVAFSAVPAAFALLASLMALEDTPTFHLMNGDDKSLSRVLNKMAATNGRPELRFDPVGAGAETWPAWFRASAGASEGAADGGGGGGGGGSGPGGTLELLAGSARPLVAACALDFAYNFVAFGLGYFVPVALSELTGGIPPIQELFLATSLSLPALYIASRAVDSELGHRQVLSVAGGVEAFGAGCLLLVDRSSGLLLLGIFALKLASTSYSQTVNTVKTELFPARIRVSALSISGTCGRVAAIIAPALIEDLGGD